MLICLALERYTSLPTSKETPVTYDKPHLIRRQPIPKYITITHHKHPNNTPPNIIYIMKSQPRRDFGTKYSPPTLSYPNAPTRSRA